MNCNLYIAKMSEARFHLILTEKYSYNRKKIVPLQRF
jgi:hypothetical protein